MDIIDMLFRKKLTIFAVCTILLLSGFPFLVSGYQYSESLTEGNTVKWEVLKYRDNGVKITDPDTTLFGLLEGSTLEVEILVDLGHQEIVYLQNFTKAYSFEVDGEPTNASFGDAVYFISKLIVPIFDIDINRFQRALSTDTPLFVGNAYIRQEGDVYIETNAEIDQYYEYRVDMETGISEFLDERSATNFWFQMQRIQDSETDEGFLSNPGILYSIIILSAIAIIRIKTKFN